MAIRTVSLNERAPSADDAFTLVDQEYWELLRLQAVPERFKRFIKEGDLVGALTCGRASLELETEEPIVLERQGRVIQLQRCREAEDYVFIFATERPLSRRKKHGVGIFMALRYSDKYENYILEVTRHRRASDIHSRWKSPRTSLELDRKLRPISLLEPDSTEAYDLSIFSDLVNEILLREEPIHQSNAELARASIPSAKARLEWYRNLLS